HPQGRHDRQRRLRGARGRCDARRARARAGRRQSRARDRGMTRVPPGSRLEWDWFDGTIPENVWIDDQAFLETTFSLERAKSERPDAVAMGRGSAAYLGTMFDLGPDARVTMGEYVLVNGVWFISDASIHVGDYAMLSWNVVLMD